MQCLREGSSPRPSPAKADPEKAGSGPKNARKFPSSDAISALYPLVDEGRTPLPRRWSPTDKFQYLGLSNSNLRINYRGEDSIRASAESSPELTRTRYFSFAVFDWVAHAVTEQKC